MDATGMMDAADTAPAVRQKDVGERCQEGECRRGACVHGVCSPICSDDDDCGTPAARCLPRGSTNRCSISCQRHDDCATGCSAQSLVPISACAWNRVSNKRVPSVQMTQNAQVGSAVGVAV